MLTTPIMLRRRDHTSHLLFHNVIRRSSSLVEAGGGSPAPSTTATSTASPAAANAAGTPSINNNITSTPASRLSRDSFRLLDIWTNEFLHPLKTPLGTLTSSSQWDVALTAVQAWLGDRKAPVPRHVDTAGCVLDRLLSEYYSQGAPTDLQNKLEPLIRKTILTWLELSEQHLFATWGIQKAERFCQTIETSWGLSAETERLALLRIKQQVIAYELSQRTAIHAEPFCRQVAEQLLTYVDSHKLLPTLDTAFREAVHQALQVAVLVKKSELNEIVSALLQRIDDLAEQSILTRFPPEEIDQIIDSLYMEGRTESPNNKLSAYEKKALHRRILTKIAAMEASDDNDNGPDEAVDELIRNWRTNVQSKDIAEWKPFAEVVTNFYLRIRDAYKATKWMQIQEQIPTPEQLQEALDVKSQRVTNIDDADVETEFAELVALENLIC
jgi:hypothetical protein